MQDQDPNLVTSGLSGQISKDGISVELCIYRLETDTSWTLEVVNAQGTSLVWDDLFLTDRAAHEAFLQVADREGMSVFLDDGNVVPFRRK